MPGVGDTDAGDRLPGVTGAGVGSLGERLREGSVGGGSSGDGDSLRLG